MGYYDRAHVMGFLHNPYRSFVKSENRGICPSESKKIGRADFFTFFRFSIDISVANAIMKANI